VLLHAFPLDATMFAPLHETGVPGVRLITPDLAGFGESALPAAEPDLASLAATVVGLLDELGLERAVVGGVSMGGYVVQALLRTAPERVAAAVLVATRHTADAEAGRERRAAMAAQVLAEHSVEPAVSGVAHLHAPDASADLVARAESIARRQRPEAVAWAQRAMAARPDSGEVLRTLRIPALVVAGEHDRVVAREESEALAGLLPRPLDVVPRAGHLVPWEQPEAFAALLATSLPGVTGT
jgi:pimeloyl-ACP methyl ester carboxylesterase